MKKKLTFIMILAVLALTSCSDFLDKYPKYGVDPESEGADGGRVFLYLVH